MNIKINNISDSHRKYKNRHKKRECKNACNGKFIISRNCNGGGH